MCCQKHLYCRIKFEQKFVHCEKFVTLLKNASSCVVAVLFLAANSSDGRVVWSVHLGSCRLGFDSESGQTNDFKIGIHSFSA